MQKKYKGIGFDWSGVVYHYGSSYPQAVEHLFGIPPEQFRPVYFTYNHLLNVESRDIREVWKKIFSHFNLENEVDAFFSYLNSLPPGSLDQEIILLITELKKQGYKVGLLSNHTLSGAQHARSICDLDSLFDVSLFSAEIHFMKPQPEAFFILAEKLGIDISELLFIDDAKKSLEGAEQVGYTPIRYLNADQLKKELSQILNV
ncbi:MAG: hypothetical protein COV59_03920 [Candidatus Magasanikbacteria bacterium CG11_big_fil_rev_8_21_14_0_20_39_34]|uniref:Haloacid dehalogenase n=1 Tax=Candidatus Magasanikbacteria bacterium CG11_big_fil_rev_8_21_14_0_20_39_34 TaxID=1974653 RepID=A0A2H0N4H7_9BACT|nr:MAG: hypothetical protein COV59_03920 [Candidatus Magasanikbacteria bacterium CG11_big_fil_rev_8_21_14_0_20_39_34]